LKRDDEKVDLWNLEFPQIYKGFILNKENEGRVVRYQKKYDDGAYIDVLLVLNVKKTYTVACRKFNSEGTMEYDFPAYSFEEIRDKQEAYKRLFKKLNELAIRSLVL